MADLFPETSSQTPDLFLNSQEEVVLERPSPLPSPPLGGEEVGVEVGREGVTSSQREEVPGRGRPVTGGGRPDAYRLKDGTRVPGTTTILGRFKDSGGLVHWAWKLGCEGVDYRRRTEDAGVAGTLTHELIEAHILGRDPVLTGKGELLTLAQKGFQAFKEWAEGSRLEVTHTEVPLVSEQWRFGGTLDAVGRLLGRLVLIDWKSSNRIYADYIVQVSAYRELWEEHFPDQRITGIHLLRVGKEFGDFHHHSWPIEVLDLGWRQFRLLRQAYDLDAPLKRAAGV